MDRAAVLQVSREDDLEALDAPALHVQVVEIAEGLRGVLVAAVTGVDDRHVGVARGQARSALARVAQDDDVCIPAPDDTHGIGQGLALGGARARHLGRGQDSSAQAQHGGLE